MGKYIIRLERGETAYKTVNLNGKPMIQLLAPLPYTEPDLEQVRADVYLKGLNDGQGVILESTQNNAFNNGYKKCLEDMEHDKGKENSIGYKIGYKKGYIDGLNRISDAEDKIRKEAYEQGLSDAWEAARKVTQVRKYGGYGDCLEEVFGRHRVPWDVFDYSASEAIEKIQAYEQEKEEQIQVGDEVTIRDKTAVVTEITDRYVRIMYSDGSSYALFSKGVVKTGRRFPEIAAVLEKMREESNG